jgi:outer membrane receptor protein involved in Fe transport
MNQYKLLLAAMVGASLCLLNSLPASAQGQGAAGIEEITVTGRNREESLQDVPVSASVLNETFLDDAGVSDLYDLFGLIPGLHYDEQNDRLGAQPSVRGVQANDISSNRVKVSAFIDGMPVLGSQGSIGFNSFQQVEVYRGPQSAAFGRSTFAGAINYITKDPTDSFEGNVQIDANDYGRRIIEGSLSGPLTDSLGYILQFEHEDSDSPSEYHALGNGLEDLALGTNLNASDGTPFGSQSGDNLSAKFVFEPTDTFRTAVTFTHVETKDSAVPQIWLTEQGRNECFEGKGIKPTTTAMGGVNIYGEWDCDWDDIEQPYSNHDDVAYLQDNPALLSYLIDVALNPQPVNLGMMMFGPAGPAATDRTINGQLLTVEEQILLVAQAYSIPEGNRGTQSERDRFTLQTEKILDSGAAVEFSYMHNEETQNRLQDTSVYYYDPDNVGVVDDGVVDGMGGGLSILWNGDPNGDGDDADGVWERLNGMGGPRYIMASPVQIEENYAELRWVSPGEDRLRYVVGASFYDYSYLEESYGRTDMGFFGVGYGAGLYGIIPEFEDLTGLTYAPDDGILSENATNSSVYFNVGYDITNNLTASLEGRYQSDKIGGLNNETGLAADVTTKSFLPRFALTYTMDEDTSYYLQYSQGVNPAGINVDLLDQTIIDSLNNGVANALIPYDIAFDVDLIDNATGLPGSDGYIDDYNTVTETFDTLTGATYNVDFTPETFIFFDEEKLTNIEFGIKGNLLDGRLTYASAIYMIDWKDQLQNGAIQWDGPCSNNQNGAAPLILSGLAPCSYEGVDYFYVPNAENTNIGGVGLNYGDVKIKGIEFEGTFRVNQNWQIRGSASYLEAEYDAFCDISLFDQGFYDQVEYRDPLNIVLLEPDENSTISSPCYVVDGNEVAGQPKLSGSLSPSFNTDLAGMRFGARMDVRYVGEQWIESGNYGTLPAVTTTNLSFSLSGDAWSATLYATNITDDNTPRRVNSGGYMDVLFPNSTTSTDFVGRDVDLGNDNINFSPSIPRSVGLRLNYNF